MSTVDTAVRFPHLALTDWPFGPVPTPEGTKFMADRSELREEIHQLTRVLSRRQQSSIHLMWAWFGAGKTHTLRYLANKAPNWILPVYTEFPKATKGFRDLYRQVAAAWDVDALASAYLDVATAPTQLDSGVVRRRDNLQTALRLLVGGTDAQSAVAMSWLEGERIPVSSLRQVGMTRSIQTVDDAVAVLSGVAQIWGSHSEMSERQPGRLLWVIDEFQRIGTCSASARSEVSTALHTLLNMTPTNLTLMLSFSGRPSRKLPEWLSPELADRVGIERVILLPPLRSDEAHVFIREVLGYYRSAGYTGDPWFPFTEKAVDRLVEMVEKQAELKPRALMQFANAVLEEADIEMERGKISEIDARLVEKCLRGRTIETGDEEEE